MVKKSFKLVLVVLGAIAFSWAVTNGILAIVFWLLRITWDWRIGTAIWLMLWLLQSMINEVKKE